MRKFLAIWYIYLGAALTLSAIHQPLLTHPQAHSRRVMSKADTSAFSSDSSPHDLQSVFDVALGEYEKKTESKLLTHPLATQLQSCDSPTAILSVFHDIIQQFDRRSSSDERLSNWLKPTVNVLFALSVTLGQDVSLLNRLFSYNPSSDIRPSGIFTYECNTFWYRNPSFGELYPQPLSVSCRDSDIY